MNVQSVGISGCNEYVDILEEAWQQHLTPKGLSAPTVISLFAGCGGSSLGYSMAGFRELMAVEWDDKAVATFKLNFQDVPVYHGDIRKLTAKECLRLAEVQPGELDLLDGSPPCQGFSLAGKRRLEDVRNSLPLQYIRLLRALQPRAFVMENVPGLVLGKMKLAFAEITKALKASGYSVRCQRLNAMYFNVPQSRRRLIWIGVRDDLGVGASYPKGQRRPFTLRQALRDVSAGLEYNKMFGKQVRVAKAMRPGQSGADILGYGKWFTHRKFRWGEPAKTVMKEAWQVYHPDRSTFFSIPELKRIFSYPDLFIIEGSWRDQSAQIGNSVPPLFIRAIGLHIRQRILQQ